MNIGKVFFNYMADIWFRRKFRLFLYQHPHQSIFIFDIDNTIAHTYPSLSLSFPSEKHRHLSLEAFPNMQHLTRAIANSPTRALVFLTARSYKMYKPTLEWLGLNQFPASTSNVIIVPSAADKIKYVEMAVSKGRKVWMVDDMTFNHENGAVKFYENEIELLLKMPLKYIGYKTIRRFQNKYL